jgi:pimeloyl-ACP methyl ester carboxylesterase
LISVDSTDGVRVALHELAGGPGQPVLLVSHATGFHGRAYLPMAAHLDPPFHVLGVDLRGHGDTPTPTGWDVDWRGFGDDATAVVDFVAMSAAPAPPPEPMTAFGHSMGGAALLMAAHRRPDRFRSLVLFEPIVFEPDAVRTAQGPSPLIAGARRRRATFPSIEEAIANYSSKPPLATFDPTALDAYVRYGFAPNGDGVRLKCEPELEARTFEESGGNGVWDLLPGIRTPTVVIAGHIADDQASRGSEAIAERLPNGRFEHVPDLDHFGPFTEPARVADLVLRAIGG